jgi:alanine racemase
MLGSPSSSSYSDFGDKHLPLEGESASLKISLHAVQENWRFLAEKVAPAHCSAVVKADAYGLGLAPVAHALFLAGCRHFFVAYVSEGLQLRYILDQENVGHDVVIYVLNGFSPQIGHLYQKNRLIPVLGALEELRAWIHFCDSAQVQLSTAFHVDTGMNRHGFSPRDVQYLSEDFSWRDHMTLSLVMSHYISSQERDSPRNEKQKRVFDHLRGLLPRAPGSLANSSGIFLPQKPYYDLVRPGYALYGGNPTPGALNPMKPVVWLQARVMSVHWVESGDTVGYDGCWVADHPRCLCTLNMGYGDGYLRAAAQTDHGQRSVLIAGTLCPCVGRVSMDMCVVDVTHLGEGVVKPGDFATVIGGALSLDAVGEQAGTIGYEILTHLGKRFHRIYHKDEA